MGRSGGSCLQSVLVATFNASVYVGRKVEVIGPAALREIVRNYQRPDFPSLP